MEGLELIYNKILDGESLAKEVLKEHGSVIDDKGNSYWWNTIDKSKKYQVRKYEYDRALQDYPVITYKIKEIL